MGAKHGLPNRDGRAHCAVWERHAPSSASAGNPDPSWAVGAARNARWCSAWLRNWLSFLDRKSTRLLQSLAYLVCRLLLEKKKKKKKTYQYDKRTSEIK